MKIIYKNKITKMMFLQLILGTLTISGATAMLPEESDVRAGMSMRSNETASQFDERVKQEHSSLIHNARMAAHGEKLMEIAEETNTSCSSKLNNNRWLWYSGFAGAGSGIWLSMAFGGPSEISPWFMIGGAAVLVTAGGVSKYIINNKYNIDVDSYMKDTCVNVAAGLSSFIPWVGFAITTATRSDTPAPAPEPNVY